MLTPDQKETVLSICEAYEAGYQSISNSEKNPFYVNDLEYFAWELGHSQAEKDLGS
jgi:hypothetical protein